MLVGDDIIRCRGLLAHLRDGALEGVVGIGIDGEGDAVALLDVADNCAIGLPKIVFFVLFVHETNVFYAARTSRNPGLLFTFADTIIRVAAPVLHKYDIRVKI